MLVDILLTLTSVEIREILCALREPHKTYKIASERRFLEHFAIMWWSSKLSVDPNYGLYFWIYTCLGVKGLKWRPPPPLSPWPHLHCHHHLHRHLYHFYHHSYTASQFLHINLKVKYKCLRCYKATNRLLSVLTPLPVSYCWDLLTQVEWRGNIYSEWRIREKKWRLERTFEVKLMFFCIVCSCSNFKNTSVDTANPL